jgi:hypothetical protein
VAKTDVAHWHATEHLSYHRRNVAASISIGAAVASRVLPYARACTWWATFGRLPSVLHERHADRAGLRHPVSMPPEPEPRSEALLAYEPWSGLIAGLVKSHGIKEWDAIQDGDAWWIAADVGLIRCTFTYEGHALVLNSELCSWTRVTWPEVTARTVTILDEPETTGTLRVIDPLIECTVRRSDGAFIRRLLMNASRK